MATDWQPGDDCLFTRGPNGEYWVKHFNCDMYRDGTVTDSDGRVVTEGE